MGGARKHAWTSNGQLRFVRHHGWRTQAAWANNDFIVARVNIASVATLKSDNIVYIIDNYLPNTLTPPPTTPTHTNQN